jgi:uncharacterized protein
MASEEIRVTALRATPVKGLRIAASEHAVLEAGGVRGDRRFYLIDERGRMVNGKHLGALNEVTAELDGDRQLTLDFPVSGRVSGPLEPGEALDTRFYSSARRARLMRGPFSAALSEHAGTQLRLVEPLDGRSAIDRGPDGGVSLISRASLFHLAQVAERSEIDARRFRMSIEIDGVGEFEEDRWVERELRVGDARLRLRGHVGRCIVTSRHPETGEVDLPTLDHLRSFRAGLATTEPLAFGVYGAVLRPGVVSVGDAVQLG